MLDALPAELDQLCKRVEALDRLEAQLTDPRAKALYDQLEAVNVELYRTIRQQIQCGAGPEILLPWAQKSGPPQGQAYDCLDELVIGILDFQEPAEPTALEPEMVFYQPTPARHIFDLIARTALTDRDVLIDLGSGLGHVALLVAICTNLTSIGIELDPAYIDCARQSAKALNLTNVKFLQQDARTANLAAGTVFYLYTPFSGTILRTVLDRLRQEASTRQIRICTFGPCTPIVAHEDWLKSADAVATDRVAVFWPTRFRR